MKSIDELKELSENIVRKIIEKHGAELGDDLQDMKLSIRDVRNIVYDEFNKVASDIFKEKVLK